MHRKLLFVWIAATIMAVAPSAVLSADDQTATRPNILLMVADDLGWNDVGYHGSRIRTPHIDRLVRDGVELDQHYVQPVCSPTRAALLSGRLPSRFGPHALVPTNRRVFPPGTITLASALQSLGYETSLSGKWHLGAPFRWGPRQYGFDHSYGSLCGAVDPWTHKYRPGPLQETWHRDDVRLDEDGNATELVAAEALARIRTSSSPWFVYVPFHAVHIPIDAPDEYKALYADDSFYDDPVKNESFKRYAAFTSQMDDKIGQFVAALDETGQRERTLILFSSDNGGLPSGGNPYVGDVAPAPIAGDNTPLRGQKNTLYEGGVRVPAFANWPGRLAPRKATAPIHAADWMPTLCNLVGFDPPRDLEWDGRDVWPQVTGESAGEPRMIRIAARFGDAVRRGDWKLIVFADEKKSAELYNLAVDPNETQNAAEANPEIVEQLSTWLAEDRKKDLPRVPEDVRSDPEGY